MAFFKKAVGFLQNAWSPYYAGRSWPRHFWLPALMASRTGQRLRIILQRCQKIDIWFDETTPIVGATPDSVVPPDIAHITSVLNQQKPDVVITFGKQAEQAVLPLCTVPTLVLPHPTYRLLTNELYLRASNLLIAGFTETVKLSQRKGVIVEEIGALTCQQNTGP